LLVCIHVCVQECMCRNFDTFQEQVQNTYNRYACKCFNMFVYMYVCMYLGMCVYISVCMSAVMDACLFLCLCVCMYVYMCVCAYIHTYSCVYICVRYQKHMYRVAKTHRMP